MNIPKQFMYTKQYWPGKQNMNKLKSSGVKTSFYTIWLSYMAYQPLLII